MIVGNLCAMVNQLCWGVLDHFWHFSSNYAHGFLG